LKFLVDEDLPKAIVQLAREKGYEAIRVPEVGLRGAKDPEIAAYCKEKKLCLLTGDFGFADIRNYPPGEYTGIVVVSVPSDSTGKFITGLFKSFFQEKSLLPELSGKLVVLEPGRIRIRK
jgi:predicted nuclease of predicted toxin-antitoxin system